MSFEPAEPSCTAIAPTYGWLGPVKRYAQQLKTAENDSSLKHAPVPYHLEGLALSLPDNWHVPDALASHLPKKLLHAVNKARYTVAVILTSNIQKAALHVERQNADWNKPGQPFFPRFIGSTPTGSRDEPVAELISARLAEAPQKHSEMFDWGLRLALGSKWMLKAAPRRFRHQARWVDTLLSKLVIDADDHRAISEWWASKKQDAKLWLRENEKLCYSWYMLDHDCESEWGSAFGDGEDAERYYDRQSKPFMEKAYAWDYLGPETIEVWKCEADGTTTRCVGGPFARGNDNDQPDLTPMPEDFDMATAVMEWDAIIAYSTSQIDFHASWDAIDASSNTGGAQVGAGAENAPEDPGRSWGSEGWEVDTRAENVEHVNPWEVNTENKENKDVNPWEVNTENKENEGRNPCEANTGGEEVVELTGWYEQELPVFQPPEPAVSPVPIPNNEW